MALIWVAQSQCPSRHKPEAFMVPVTELASGLFKLEGSLCKNYLIGKQLEGIR